MQQSYLAALGSHINNIYHKISEIQQQLPQHTQHMITGDIIQINAPEFDPDIDSGLPTKECKEIQGSDSSIQHLLEETKTRKALLYHNKSQKKWIGRMQYQSRSRHK